VRSGTHSPGSRERAHRDRFAEPAVRTALTELDTPSAGAGTITGMDEDLYLGAAVWGLLVREMRARQAETAHLRYPLDSEEAWRDALLDIQVLGGEVAAQLGPSGVATLRALARTWEGRWAALVDVVWDLERLRRGDLPAPSTPTPHRGGTRCAGRGAEHAGPHSITHSPGSTSS
jgi:hypothetical protein